MEPKVKIAAVIGDVDFCLFAGWRTIERPLLHELRDAHGRAPERIVQTAVDARHLRSARNEHRRTSHEDTRRSCDVCGGPRWGANRDSARRGQRTIRVTDVSRWPRCRRDDTAALLRDHSGRYGTQRQVWLGSGRTCHGEPQLGHDLILQREELGKSAVDRGRSRHPPRLYVYEPRGDAKLVAEVLIAACDQPGSTEITPALHNVTCIRGRISRVRRTGYGGLRARSQDD